MAFMRRGRNEQPFEKETHEGAGHPKRIRHHHGQQNGADEPAERDSGMQRYKTHADA
jgi:hypothetical protein